MNSKRYPHVEETGCNLQREDFLPDDGPCIDGGAPEDHPSVTDEGGESDV